MAVCETQVPRIAGVYTRQPFDTCREMILGCGPIDDPPARSHSVSGRIAPPPVKLGQIRVFHSDEVELAAARRHRLVNITHKETAALSETGACRQCHQPRPLTESVHATTIVARRVTPGAGSVHVRTGHSRGCFGFLLFVSCPTALLRCCDPLPRLCT